MRERRFSIAYPTVIYLVFSIPRTSTLGIAVEVRKLILKEDKWKILNAGVGPISLHEMMAIQTVWELKFPWENGYHGLSYQGFSRSHEINSGIIILHRTSNSLILREIVEYLNRV